MKAEDAFAVVCDVCGYYLYFPYGAPLPEAARRGYASHAEARPDCDLSEPLLIISAGLFREMMAETLPVN